MNSCDNCCALVTRCCAIQIGIDAADHGVIALMTQDNIALATAKVEFAAANPQHRFAAAEHMLERAIKLLV